MANKKIIKLANNSRSIGWQRIVPLSDKFSLVIQLLQANEPQRFLNFCKVLANLLEWQIIPGTFG